MLAMLHTEFCRRRAVLSDEEFQVLFGLSRAVPGMNLLALTVLLGHHTHGLPGALLALTAMSAPSFASIVALCLLLRGQDPAPVVRGIIRALGPTAAALMLHAGWQSCAGVFRRQSWRARGLWLLVSAATATLAVVAPFHPAWLILLGAMAGIFFSHRGWLGTRE